MTEREERDYHALRIIMEEHDLDIDEAKDFLAELVEDAAYVYGESLCCDDRDFED